MSRLALRLAAAGTLFLLAARSAQAHHAMDGELPASLGQGLLSGLAHPVIGLDHLAFIVAAGLIAGAAGVGLAMPLVFVVASMLGVFLHLLALDLPAAELVIAASVLAAGVLLAWGRATGGRGLWLALFVIAGLFHGYAYGESIVGAEATPLLSYLAGLFVVQAAIGLGAAALASNRSWTTVSLAPRLAGAVVMGIGVSALAGQLIPG
ncbi:HupE/UreJ family protein [Geminicoccus roseus]|uniref:HupE/UreJ family protein n=1 Tax=Geminicoccus roseus TaxID=404900 RepID=UPI00055491EC|nr:HupE/UreJ family protein [Geminicoccus roseus]